MVAAGTDGMTGLRRKIEFKKQIVPIPVNLDEVIDGRRRLAAKRRERFDTPTDGANNNAVTHKKSHPLRGRPDRLVDRLETPRLGHFHTRNKAWNDMSHTKDIDLIQHPANPLVASDMARFSRRDDCEEIWIPDFKVRRPHGHANFLGASFHLLGPWDGLKHDRNFVPRAFPNRGDESEVEFLLRLLVQDMLNRTAVEVNLVRAPQVRKSRPVLHDKEMES